ncbi:MAG TPA: hypothetical protein VMH23_05700 [Bacteroidota bacterium]|nr:hypothetical protein [Bacteroidota bacterium]
MRRKPGCVRSETARRTLRYTTLPQCVGMMKSVEFDLLEARTSVSEPLISEQVDTVLNGEHLSYLLREVNSVASLAEKVREAGTQIKPRSFIVVAQKPMHEPQPGFFSIS